MLDRLIIAAALAMLAACGYREPVAPAATPETPAISAPDPLSVRPTGVGPLGDGTPFDKALVERAFPGATIESAIQSFGAERTSVLNVLAGGTQTLQIRADDSGQVAAIVVTGGDYVAPGGERLMARWPDATLTLDDCVMGDGPSIHALVCRKPGAKEIEYIFGIPGWTSSETPPADVLQAKAFLREMVWTATPTVP